MSRVSTRPNGYVQVKEDRNTIASVQRAIAQLTALNTNPDWTAPTLINSWTNQGTPYETAGYLKDSLGFVHTKGVVQGGASGSIAFQYPAGFRPGATGIYTIGNGNGLGSSFGAIANINISGNFTITWIGAGSLISLHIPPFLAEN